MRTLWTDIDEVTQAAAQAVQTTGIPWLVVEMLPRGPLAPTPWSVIAPEFHEAPNRYTLMCEAEWAGCDWQPHGEVTREVRPGYGPQ